MVSKLKLVAGIVAEAILRKKLSMAIVDKTKKKEKVLK